MGLSKMLSRQKTVESVSPEGELKAFRKQHRYDLFLDNDKLEAVDAALHSGNAEKLKDLDNDLIQEDSPYPEVRAAVRDFRKYETAVLLGLCANQFESRFLPPMRTCP